VKGKNNIWFLKLKEKGGIRVDRDLMVFAFFLFLSFVFWYLNEMGKETE